ncbi:MAG: LysM peptidoglycan-binding domain-containing protein [Chloroflexota bacterium]|nr:LysM peptidoglycan-binding domain-containing protein [Chloroflexota bacterium]
MAAVALGAVIALHPGVGWFSDEASAHSQRPAGPAAPDPRPQEEPAPEPPAESDPETDPPADDGEQEPGDDPAEEPPEAPDDAAAETPADAPAEQPAAPTAPVPRAPATGNTYVVQPGDWVALIAASNGITVADIVRLNPEVTAPGYVIQPGQVLILREDPQPEAAVEPAPVAAAEEPAAEEAAEPEPGPEAAEAAVPAQPAPAPAAAPAPAPQTVVQPAEEALSGGGNRLVTDIAIGVAGLATGIALAILGPWLRRLKRGY